MGGPFHPSIRQIVRQAFDSVNDAIRVISYRDDSKKSQDAQNIILLKEIVEQLKILNLYLSEMSEIEFDESEK
jgi:hypothetical protein